MPLSHLLVVCWTALILGGFTAMHAAEPLPAALDAYLDSCQAGYSTEHRMLGMPFQSPGYHSQVPQGTWVHPTRQSLDYAVMLIRRGQPDDLQRGEQIIGKVLSLQVTDPTHEYYGIWPWLLEEPVEQMAPPDRNWADFLGAQLAVLLKEYPDRLSASLLAAMQSSLLHAALEIQQRDVQPGYTNIAIMGGGVCAAAGELLEHEELLRYGRERLRRCVAHTDHHGSFNEYNSPTYTRVALFEAERVLQLVADQATREAAESLRRIAWQVIADSYHPGTGQWAGPHSRTYSDLLSASVAEYLAAQTGATIPVHDPEDDHPATVDAIQHVPCPAELHERFRRLPTDPLEIRRTFIRDANGDDATVGTSWFTADACLGSVNRSMLWTQRRTLIGYWTTPREPVVVFRQRFLHDGKDFASLGVRNQQCGPRVLSLFEPLRNHGSWHPTLDRPADGVFSARDFRVRYELNGRGAAARQLGPAAFELRAGHRRVVVHTPPGRFAGIPVAWRCDTLNDCAVVDGVCYAGEPRAFNFQTLEDVVMMTALELLDDQQTPLAPPTWTGDATSEAAWNVGERTLQVTR
jgi:hypothetical protein